CVVDPSNPDVVYATASAADLVFPAQILKSTDAGRNFFRVGVGLPRLQFSVGLAVAPTDPLTVYVMDQGVYPGPPFGKLFLSSDGGLNFTELPNALSLPLGLYPHPTEDGKLLVLAGASALFVSTDRGTSFVQLGTGLPPWTEHLAFDRFNPSVVYAAAGPDG